MGGGAVDDPDILSIVDERIWIWSLLAKWGSLCREYPSLGNKIAKVSGG